MPIFRSALLFGCWLLPAPLLAQMATDTCCQPAAGLASHLVRPVRAAAAAPAVLPTCYPPLLVAAEPLPYAGRSAARPLFKWKSGAPIYATDEQFTFRLIALPSNTIVYELVTPRHELSWPAGLKVPPLTTQLYYTVQASRRDPAGQQCVSPSVRGTLRLEPEQQW